MPTSARMIACRNRTGPPSSRTIRRPRASLPTERPRVSVSTVAGATTITPIVTVTDNAAMTASLAPAPAPAAIASRDTTHSTAMKMIASSSPDSRRLAKDAGRASRITPSPMRISSDIHPPHSNGASRA